MHAPEEYEQHKSQVRTDIDQSMSLILEHVNMRHGDLILDYGCGPGATGNKHFLPLADKYDSYIHAVDISSEMVEHARSNFSHPRITYVGGNILTKDFPLATFKFDKIFSIHVFHYIKDYRSAMQRFFEILNPGGQFAFTVVITVFLFKTYRMLGEDPRFKPYMKGYDEFIPQWYEEKECPVHAKECFEKAARASGFTVKYMEIQNKNHKVNMDVQLGLFLALNPFIDVIPAELHGALRDAYQKDVCERFNLKADMTEFEFKYELLTAVVEKPLMA